MGSAKLIATRAREFARLYVQLTEALMREGVVEGIAREEARITATSWLMSEMELERFDAEGADCPLCGRARGGGA